LRENWPCSHVDRIDHSGSVPTWKLRSACKLPSFPLVDVISQVLSTPFTSAPLWACDAGSTVAALAPGKVVVTTTAGEPDPVSAPTWKVVRDGNHTPVPSNHTIRLNRKRAAWPRELEFPKIHVRFVQRACVGGDPLTGPAPSDSSTMSPVLRDSRPCFGPPDSIAAFRARPRTPPPRDDNWFVRTPAGPPSTTIQDAGRDEPACGIMTALLGLAASTYHVDDSDRPAPSA